jgi:restriction system protein
MAYRNIKDSFATIFGLVLYFTVYFIVGLGIKWIFFEKANTNSYWTIYILTIGGLIFIGIVSKQVKKKIERYKLQNTYCRHGIKGGKTLALCDVCKIEHEQVRQREEARIKEQERKNIIKQKALELRNEEIIRFTKINLRNKEFLYEISPREFEDVIAEMYRALGYDVKQTPYSNDKGKDIILKKDGKKYLVECKRYNFENTIGREALQKFFAAIIEEEAEKGFFVTTSGYTSTSIQYAKERGNIELINGNKLVILMREIYPENYNSNLVKIMCIECGEIVEFTFKSNDLIKPCKNGHSVQNDFDTEILSPRYLSSNKYCVKCGKPMKLVYWKKKHFWGCSGYPKCRSYQRYISS